MRREKQLERNAQALAAMAGGGQSLFVTVSMPNLLTREARLSMWAAVRRELFKHLRPGRPHGGRFTVQHPGGVVAWCTYRLSKKPQAWVPACAERRNVRQITLAEIALHAGWKFRPLPGLGLFDSLPVIAPAFGLSH